MILDQIFDVDGRFEQQSSHHPTNFSTPLAGLIEIRTGELIKSHHVSAHGGSITVPRCGWAEGTCCDTGVASNLDHQRDGKAREVVFSLKRRDGRWNYIDAINFWRHEFVAHVSLLLAIKSIFDFSRRSWANSFY